MKRKAIIVAIATGIFSALSVGYGAYVSSYPATASSGATLSSSEWNKMVSAIQTLDTNLSAFSISWTSVWIGTPPNTKLSVNGNISPMGYGIIGRNAWTVPTSWVFIAANNGSSDGGYAMFYWSNATNGTDDRRGNVDIGAYSVGWVPGKINFMDYNGSTWDVNAVILPNGNVGIWTAAPAQRLEINGNLKFTQNGSVISKAPRSARATDPAVWCPASRAANTDLWTLPITVDRSATVMITANSIKLSTARADLQLYVDGAQVNQTIAPAVSGDWAWATVQWTGTLAAGSHTVSVRSPQASVWGCTSWWAIDALIFEN